MSKITFTREIEEAKIMAHSLLNGYEETISIDIEETVLVEKANLEGWHIKEVGKEDTTLCIAITGTKEEPSSETPTEFMASIYQKLIDNKMKADELTVSTKAIEEARKLEDEAIKKAVEEGVGETIISIT